MNRSPGAVNITLFLVTLAGLVAAIVLGNSIAGSDYKILAAIFAGFFVLVLWFALGLNFWVLTVATVFLQGGLNFTGGFSVFQVLMMVGVCKFILENIVFKKQDIQKGPRADLFFIMGFMSILFFHMAKDRMGMRILGSSVWGGKMYVAILFSFIAYFIIYSLPKDGKIWSRLPLIVLLVFGFDLVIGVATMLKPGLVDVIWPIYTGVSLGGYVDQTLGMQEDVTERVGAWGKFGIGVMGLALAYYSLRELWKPEKILGLLAVLAGLVSSIASGFRSGVIGAFVLLFAAAVRDFKKKAFLLVPLGVVGIFFLIVVNEIYPLPKQAQRALCFLPGTWDREMVIDAESSNEFRINIWTLWYKKIFWENPLFGRGYGFDPIWAAPDDPLIQDKNWDLAMIYTGLLHNGFLSVLDNVGIVGMVFFVGWNVVVLFRALRYLLYEDSKKSNPALRWLGLMLVLRCLTFWYGAANLGTYLPVQFLLVAVFNMLLLEQRKALNSQVPTRDAPDKKLPDAELAGAAP